MSQTATGKLLSTILLYGPSGSGKSTVGSLLAQRLNLPFVDLDVEIAARAGQPIPEIFAARGEGHFRALEQEALAEALSPQRPLVIALGGGALLNASNRALAGELGRVVLLTAPPKTLLARLEQDMTEERPLLAGNAESNLHALLAHRADHYAAFPIRVDTSGKTPAEVVWEIQVRLGWFRLHGMESRKHPAYDVLVHPGGLEHIGELLTARGLHGPVVVVTDDNVGALYLEPVLAALRKSGFQAHGVTIPAGEEHKTQLTIARLWEAFSAAGIERRNTVVALGVGVVGDLAGFAAATWLRGVPWVAVPTSLLAMVDASLGGKTGADLPQGKNLIGAFHPPRLVLADPDVLGTLPDIEFTNGLAEVVKHGVIADAGLVQEICTNHEDLSPLVRRAMAVKVRVIEADPYEENLRAALNFGHTVGHGVELASGFRIRHGEAVAIGMVAETRLAENIGLATPGLAEEIAAVLAELDLPTEIPPELDSGEIIAAMQRDKKKSGGVVRFALPVAIGEVRVGVEVTGWEDAIKKQVTKLTG